MEASCQRFDIISPLSDPLEIGLVGQSLGGDNEGESEDDQEFPPLQNGTYPTFKIMVKMLRAPCFRRYGGEYYSKE